MLKRGMDCNPTVGGQPLRAVKLDGTLSVDAVALSVVGLSATLRKLLVLIVPHLISVRFRKIVVHQSRGSAYRIYSNLEDG